MSAQPERGVVVGGRYRLEAILGEGGMAVVWRAVHTETDRAVALKLVRRELVTDDQVREMFVREARITARIGKSPFIVDVLDAGLDPALEVPFIAMELLDGEGLDARLKRAGAVPLGQVLEWTEHVAEALDQAHGAGVFHRDLKPQNLFVSRDKRMRESLKVLDFGIAKLAESVAASSTHVGTPAYSAPEQLGPSWRSIAEGRGKVIASQVSAATDVWALGLVVYEMLIGASSGSLWGATTLAELPVKIVLEPPPVPSQRAGDRAPLLPGGFDAWLLRCLDLDASKRFASAGEAAAALASLPRADAAPRPAHSPSPSQAPPAHTPQPIAVRGSLPSWPLVPSQPPTATPYAPNPVTPPGLGHTPRPYPQAQHLPTGFAPAPPHGTPLPAHGQLDPMLLSWATQRGAEVHAQGDPRVYAACNPLQFLAPVANTFRDARLMLRDAQLLLGEVGLDDALKKAMGEDRVVLAVLSSQRIRFRAALRSKQTSGLAEGMARGWDSLVGMPKVATLGDAQLEARFDLAFPSQQEGHHALPFQLRKLLVDGNFRGTFEVRNGGFVLTMADVTRFEPVGLDRLLEVCSRIYGVLAP